MQLNISFRQQQRDILFYKKESRFKFYWCCITWKISTNKTNDLVLEFVCKISTRPEEKIRIKILYMSTTKLIKIMRVIHLRVFYY
ncbi:unnamed protein product [Paramecium octaurelia]|uniref:Uncharacterized protein n=1 Tax=Paramecium octaurelia TaxID=43137 RepID=A0A8S1TT45_PAROT|nr:unnamed protein product [Paramecium octaurelia]